jgi:hypothetical protein
MKLTAETQRRGEIFAVKPYFLRRVISSSEDSLKIVE